MLPQCGARAPSTSDSPAIATAWATLGSLRALDSSCPITAAVRWTLAPSGSVTSTSR